VPATKVQEGADVCSEVQEARNYPLSRILALQDRVRQAARAAPSLERAAQQLAELMFEDAGGAIVLARVFATGMFASLPREEADFATLAARKGKAEALLQASTPVLALLGTYGIELAWRQRTLSKDHRALPLVSRDFVHGRPMMSSLLSELGLPFGGPVRIGNGVKLEQLMGGDSTRLFHVLDAATATDAEGRKIIPRQDFVRSYGVCSVFALGGTWPNGSSGFLVVFSRDSLTAGVARRLAPIVTVFRSATTSLVMQGRYFDP
jgi:hypothetical protein